jgi:hypothetical protein
VRSLALAVTLAVLAGCTGSPRPGTQPTTGDSQLPLQFAYASEPRPEAGAGGIDIVWNFTGAWHPLAPSTPLNVTLDVKLYGRNPAGAATTTLQFRGGESKTFEFRTPFLGPGDYYYKIDAHDAAGTLMGRHLGFYETCLC